MDVKTATMDDKTASMDVKSKAMILVFSEERHKKSLKYKKNTYSGLDDELILPSGEDPVTGALWLRQTDIKNLRENSCRFGKNAYLCSRNHKTT